MTFESRPTEHAPADAVACIDLGKTSCRVRVVEGGATLFENQGSGAPGLAESHGAARAAEAIETIIQTVPENIRLSISSIVIGAAGVEAAPAAAQELARLTAITYAARVTVASDVVIAHAGALAGAPGTVLVVGTGAVALALHDDGGFHQADGWGPWVGDDGSGRWIGQEGIRLGLRALDGRDRPSALSAAMTDMIGSPHDVPSWISASRNPARTLASFAQIVLDLAEDGDAQASSIISRAVAALTETVRAVSSPSSDVCVVGGVAGRKGFRAALESTIAELGFTPVRSSGGPLEGALLLATQPESAYDQKVFHA